MAFEWNKIFILCGRKRLVILHKIQHSKFPAAGYRRTIRLQVRMSCYTLVTGLIATSAM